MLIFQKHVANLANPYELFLIFFGPKSHENIDNEVTTEHKKHTHTERERRGGVLFCVRLLWVVELHTAVLAESSIRCAICTVAGSGDLEATYLDIRSTILGVSRGGPGWRDVDKEQSAWPHKMKKTSRYIKTKACIYIIYKLSIYVLLFNAGNKHMHLNVTGIDSGYVFVHTCTSWTSQLQGTYGKDMSSG